MHLLHGTTMTWERPIYNNPYIKGETKKQSSPTGGRFFLFSHGGMTQLWGDLNLFNVTTCYQQQHSGRIYNSVFSLKFDYKKEIKVGFKSGQEKKGDNKCLELPLLMPNKNM